MENDDGFWLAAARLRIVFFTKSPVLRRKFDTASWKTVSVEILDLHSLGSKCANVVRATTAEINTRNSLSNLMSGMGTRPFHFTLVC